MLMPNVLDFAAALFWQYLKDFAPIVRVKDDFFRYHLLVCDSATSMSCASILEKPAPALDREICCIVIVTAINALTAAVLHPILSQRWSEL
jgi:hypothetical protein